MTDDVNQGSGGGPPAFPAGGSEGSPTVPPPGPPSAPPPPGSGSTAPPQAPPEGYAPPPPESYPWLGPSGPQAVPYASWGLRVGGYLIDFVILAVVQGILDLALRHSGTGSVHFTMTTNHMVRHHNFSILALALGFVVSIAYATVLIGGRGGQTVGMMAVSVRCRRDATHGRVGYGLALGRSLIAFVFGLTVIVWIIDMLFPLWDPKRQTLHDKIVGTVVLRSREAG